MTTDSKPDDLPKGVRPIPYDDDEDDEPYGDPSRVKDESPLESLGKAVSEPLRDQVERDGRDAPPVPPPSPKP